MNKGLSWIVIVAIAVGLIIGGVFGLYQLILKPSGEFDSHENVLVDVKVGTEVGQDAPNFTLTNISGEKFSLNDYREKVIVIDFMATLCGSCKTEMEHRKKVSSKYGGEVKLLSIDVDPGETVDTIRKFKKSFGAEWIFASGPKVGTTYRVSGIPTLYVIGENGRISYKNVGLAPYSDLSLVLDNMLKEGSEKGGT